MIRRLDIGFTLMSCGTILRTWSHFDSHTICPIGLVRLPIHPVECCVIPCLFVRQLVIVSWKMDGWEPLDFPFPSIIEPRLGRAGASWSSETLAITADGAIKVSGEHQSWSFARRVASASVSPRLQRYLWVSESYSFRPSPFHYGWPLVSSSSALPSSAQQVSLISIPLSLSYNGPSAHSGAFYHRKRTELFFWKA